MSESGIKLHSDDDLFAMAKSVIEYVESLIPLPVPDEETADWLDKAATLRPVERMERLEMLAVDDAGIYSKERMLELERHVRAITDSHREAVNSALQQRRNLMHFATIRFFGVEHVNVTLRNWG
jgi:hypothetical protein